MKNCIIIALLFAAFCWMLPLHAQSLERMVIGSTGEYSTSANISLSSTVGEAAVATLISGSVILTQGFQQPDANPSTGIAEELQILVDYMLYPNPTSGLLNFSFTASESVKLALDVYDLQGRQMIPPGDLFLVRNTYESELDLSSLADGLYLLRLLNSDGETVRTFKIQKE